MVSEFSVSQKVCSTPRNRCGSRQVVTAYPSFVVHHVRVFSQQYCSLPLDSPLIPFRSPSSSSRRSKLCFPENQLGAQSDLERLARQFRSVSGVLSRSLSSQVYLSKIQNLCVSLGHCLAIYLTYLSGLPRLVSRSIKLVWLSIDLRYSLPLCFPEEKYDTLEYSKVKCYSGDSVRLQNIYSNRALETPTVCNPEFTNLHLNKA